MRPTRSQGGNKYVDKSELHEHASYHRFVMKNRKGRKRIFITYQKAGLGGSDRRIKYKSRMRPVWESDGICALFRNGHPCLSKQCKCNIDRLDIYPLESKAEKSRSQTLFL